MSDFDSGPRIEKRILPLLDVALALVGILIILVTLSNQKQVSGIEGNVATVRLTKTGQLLLGESILGNADMGLDAQEMKNFMEHLETQESPLVLIYFHKSERTASTKMVSDFISQVEESGVNIKAIAEQLENGEGE